MVCGLNNPVKGDEGRRGAVPAVMAVTGSSWNGAGRLHNAVRLIGPEISWRDGGQETAAARDTGSGLPVQWSPYWLAGDYRLLPGSRRPDSASDQLL
jgi:hypothetical protein